MPTNNNRMISNPWSYIFKSKFICQTNNFILVVVAIATLLLLYPVKGMFYLSGMNSAIYSPVLFAGMSSVGYVLRCVVISGFYLVKVNWVFSLLSV